MSERYFERSGSSRHLGHIGKLREYPGLAAALLCLSSDGFEFGDKGGQVR